MSGQDRQQLADKVRRGIDYGWQFGIPKNDAHAALNELMAALAQAERERDEAGANAEREYLAVEKQALRAEAAEQEMDEARVAADAVRQALPSTFYAHLPTERRIEMLAQTWNRAVMVTNQLERERDEAREPLNELVGFVNGGYHEGLDPAYRDTLAVIATHARAALAAALAPEEPRG